MIRMLLWKISFVLIDILAPLLRRTAYFGRPVQYFAFGANVHEDVLRLREMKPLSSTLYILEDFEIDFSHAGPYKGLAFGAIYRKPGDYVVGKLIGLTRIDALRMDFFELVPFFKRHRRAYVEGEQGVLFYYHIDERAEGLRPNKAYRDKIISGLEGDDPKTKAFREKLMKVETQEALEFSEEPLFVFASYRWAGPFSGWAIAYDRLCFLIFARWFYPHRVSGQK